MRWQLIHRHPVAAGTALVLPHSLQRGLKVLALARLLHKVARSRALVSVRRRRRFLAPLSRRGFTPIRQRQLQLPGHLRPFASEAHVRFALLSVRSFAVSGYYDLG
jgi:hypothetical protein